MSDVADRYRQLSETFADLVASVPESQWSAQSPCEQWSALAVVQHVIDTHGMFEQLAGRPFDPPQVDPSSALEGFRDVQSIVQADLDDPERAGAAWDGYFGRTNFAAGIDRFVCFDLVVHAWDLAWATDVVYSMPPGEMDRIEADLGYFGDALYASGAVGAPLDPPPDANRQTRVLAALGRAG